LRQRKKTSLPDSKGRTEVFHKGYYGFKYETAGTEGERGKTEEEKGKTFQHPTRARVSAVDPAA